VLLPPSGVLGIGSSGGLVSMPCSLRPRALGRAAAWPAAHEVQAQVSSQHHRARHRVSGMHPGHVPRCATGPLDRCILVMARGLEHGPCLGPWVKQCCCNDSMPWQTRSRLQRFTTSYYLYTSHFLLVVWHERQQISSNKLTAEDVAVARRRVRHTVSQLCTTRIAHHANKRQVRSEELHAPQSRASRSAIAMPDVFIMCTVRGAVQLPTNV
jgi:hypothetical protein